MSDPGAVQITLPRWAGVAVALFAIGMLDPLVTQIVLLEEQRETVRSQRAILKAQSRQASPVLEDATAAARRPRCPAMAAPGHDLARRRSARRGPRAGDAVDHPDAAVTGDLQSALRETRQRDLLRRAAAAADAVPELLRLQRQTLGILQQSMAIQRSTEQHAASLDRKTGGTAPAPVLPPLP